MLSAILLSLMVAPQAQAQSKFVVVQNVATERTRVYERCTTSIDCPHRLVLDTKMLVGMPKDEGTGAEKHQLRTWLGAFKIEKWRKFYKDGAGLYPSWHSPGYPKLPRVGASLFDWISPRLVLDKRKENMRGAFGWYAAHVGPNANAQWMHGTFGWGADKDKFMKKLVVEGGEGYLNFSSGCTRIENRGIAYLQNLLPVGTEVIRVYAKEALRDSSLSRYAAQKTPKIWNYILTSEAVNAPAISSDRDAVLARGVTPDQILEKGVYEVPQYPIPIGLLKSRQESKRIEGYTGNIYGIDTDSFRGVYLVDEGKFINYQDPSELSVGGAKAMAADLRSQGDYDLAKPNFGYKK